MAMTDAEWEYAMYGEPTAILECPLCRKPFKPFMRGEVTRAGTWAHFWARITRKPFPTSALICWECKQIVGFE